jgi:thioredoxin reductase (NADPH)
MEKLDIVIIGAGPAGITAGIFAVRRSMNVVVLGDPTSMSTMEEATIVDDWPGVPNIMGPELVRKFKEHAKKLGVPLKDEKAVEISRDKKLFVVKTDKGEYATKTVIIATGAKHRKAMVPGEKEFSGKGVSYCANCDGPVFKGRKVAVIGGGDTAATYALLMDQIGAQTTLIHRRDELRAVDTYIKALKRSKIKLVLNTVLKEIKGERMVKSIVIQDIATKKTTEIPMDGVFIAIGTVPSSELGRALGIAMDEGGFIKVDRKQMTNIPGIFAAGDCSDNCTKRIVTSAAEGSVAAEMAHEYINEKGL